MEATPNVNVEQKSTDEYFATSLPEAAELILRKALRQIIYSQKLPDPITIEQMARRVLAEELDQLKQYHTLVAEPHTVPKTQAPKTPRKKLVFSNPSLPKIYTGNKVLDRNDNPLELYLVDINYRSGDQIRPIPHDLPLKVGLFVLYGDFRPTGFEDTWTSQEFDDNIVKERSGKSPLLVGNLQVMLKHGKTTIDDIKFTDNSSWTRSNTFKIGARLLATGINDDLSGVVLEAVTEAFRVDEHRMQLMAKRYPPNLDDEVWRLEKIRKDGAFHKRLHSAGIYTVKDILNLSATPDGKGKLRGILARMPDKWWEAMLKHAMTCKTEGSRSFWEKTLAQLRDELVNNEV